MGENRSKHLFPCNILIQPIFQYTLEALELRSTSFSMRCTTEGYTGMWGMFTFACVGAKYCASQNATPVNV